MSLNIQSPDPNQAKVFDVADPDRHGKIINRGPQVSEVRFDDGAVRNIANKYLRAAEPKTDGLSQLNPLQVSETIRLGQEAMARKRRGWEDWLLIAEALQEGRTDVMRALHINIATGRRFEKAMSEWLIAHSFKEIDKGTRSRLLECLRHKADIEKWRATLTGGQRFTLNHPDAVLRKWKKATAAPAKDVKPKSSAFQKVKDELVAALEERDRYKREVERGGGDLWTPEDTPKVIAKIMLGKLSKSKAENVAREILKALKEANK